MLVRSAREMLNAWKSRDNLKNDLIRYFSKQENSLYSEKDFEGRSKDYNRYYSDSGVVMTGVTALAHYGYCSGRSHYVEARSTLFEKPVDMSVNDYTIYVNSGIEEESIELDGGTLYVDLFTALYEAMLILSDDSAITIAIIDMRIDGTLDKFLDWAKSKKGVDIDFVNEIIEEYGHSGYWE